MVNPVQSVNTGTKQTATVTDNTTGKSFELPIMNGTMGPRVIDVRTIVPLDEETILESVKKTGRVVIVQEAPRTCGFAAEISAIIAEEAILYLEAPILRVTGPDTPFPYTLEHIYMPDPERVALAVGKAMNF